MKISVIRICIYVLVFCSFAGAAHAQQSITNLGDLPGGAVTGFGTNISSDGSVVVGYSDSASGTEAFRWSGGVMTGLGDLAGGAFQSNAFNTNADGSVVVGYGTSASGTEAFRWNGGVMTGLGDLAGGAFLSVAYSTSADGSVIVGYSNSASGTEAFRWSGGVMAGLGDLAGGAFESTAYGISADGLVVVGYSESAGGYEAFRWSGGVMTGLGDLAGGIFDSAAYAVNGDGSVVVGYGVSASGYEAFRWEGGVMTGLGDLAGGGFLSAARAVNADGSVVVGYSISASGIEAFRWTQATGMERLADILTVAGVDLTGITLNFAYGVDATGDMIVGRLTFGGNAYPFLANLSSGSAGVTTFEDLIDGLTSATVPAQQAQGAMNNSFNQSLFAAMTALPSLERVPTAHISYDGDLDSITPAAGGDDYLFGAYAVGSFGIAQDNDPDNRTINGTTGLLMQVTDGLAIGGGIIGSTGRSDLDYGGESRLDSKGGSIIAAYEGTSGLRVYGTAFAAQLDADINRHYLNGAGIDGSSGKTDGYGYGAALRAGWEVPVNKRTSVTPYGEIEASKTKLDSYAEEDGAFPASFDEQESTQVTSRLGAEVEYRLSPALKVGAHAAWGHRIKDDDHGGLSVSTMGFTGTLGGEDDDKNWAEAGISSSWQATPSTTLNAQLSGRTHKTQNPAGTLTIGVSVRF